MTDMSRPIIAKISDLHLGVSVLVDADMSRKRGTVVGRRMNGQIEGYLCPSDINGLPSSEGPDMVQVAIPFEPHGRDWVTTGLTTFPWCVELVDE